MQNEQIPYDQLVKRRGTDALRQQEIPETHAISLGLPTLRAGRPGYAFFAAPALRVPGKPQIQDAPDRWWVVSANDAKLLLYALNDALPFSEHGESGKQELTPPDCTLEVLKARLKHLGDLVGGVAPKFFRHEFEEKGVRTQILGLLDSSVPPELRTQYKELVPDFYMWLEA